MQCGVVFACTTGVHVSPPGLGLVKPDCDRKTRCCGKGPSQKCMTMRQGSVSNVLSLAVQVNTSSTH